jgi:Tfp pilus assembly protein PilF
LGWGIGGFREAYDRSKSDTLKRLEAEGGRTADQAHSFYLETLAERGVLGLAAFLCFVACCGWAAFAALGSGPVESRLIAAGLIASVAALLAHAALEDNLSFVPHGTLLFANLGLLVAAAPGPRVAGRSGARVLGGGGLVAALIAVALSGASATASAEARAGARALVSGAGDRGLPELRAATSLAPWSDEHWTARAEAALAPGQGELRPADLREAERAYREAIAVNGSDPVTRHRLARLYLAHPAEFGSAGVASALGELRTALAQNPYYAEIRNDLGVALLASGDRAGAAGAFGDASNGRREFVDPLLNLAALRLQDGATAEADQLISTALERNPGSARAAAMRASRSGQHESR